MAAADACSANPEKKPWASEQCDKLTSNMFERCHAAVPPTDYYQRCLSDTCACDMGGDCECLCTALSAYADACNRAGIHIAWRSQDLCREYKRIIVTPQQAKDVEHLRILCLAIMLQTVVKHFK